MLLYHGEGEVAGLVSKIELGGGMRVSFVGRSFKKNSNVSDGCEVETGKKMRGHEDRRESFPYFTDKALNIQKNFKA